MYSSAQNPFQGGHPTVHGIAVNSVVSARKPRIILAATGSVSAIKFGILARALCQWADVKAVGTNSSLRFINPSILPLECPLYTDEHEWGVWKNIGDDVMHVTLHQWADAMIIAPLSANTLAKIASGICDNLLTCIARAWDFSKPLYVAPAMNAYMWNNIFTRKHLEFLNALGVNIITSTPLNSPSGGDGAMAEPTLIDRTVKLAARNA